MAKEILCSFGVDVDAVAGWLGSYGGEDSPDDISRGLFCRRGRQPAPVEAVRTASASRPPGSSPATRSRRSRSRCRLWPMPATRSASTATRHENPIAMTRGAGGARSSTSASSWSTQLSGQPADRLCRAVVGVLPASATSCCWKTGIKYDHSLMHKDFDALLCPRRRQLDQDRLSRRSRANGWCR